MMKCDICREKIEVTFVTCEECCEHEFDPCEGNMCLQCGKDGSEDIAAAAFDRAKDIRKYGR